MLHRLRDLAQRRGPWVVRAVHAVAEAHEPVALRDRLAHPRLGALRRADLVDLLYDLGRVPPWSGPFIAPIARQTADARSAQVE